MTSTIRSSIGRALPLAAALTLGLPALAQAQDEEASGVTVGVAGEIVNQFVWRGLLLNDGLSLQPDVWLESGNLSFGVWSSIPLDGDFSEVDTYLSWYQELPVGELTLTAFDQFYPGEEDEFDDFGNFGGVEDGEPTGAHTVELVAEFSPTALPLDFMLGWNVWNDPDKALYARVGTGLSFPAFDLDGAIGFSLNDSPYYYGSEGGDVLDYVVSASRAFALGAFEPYASVTYVRSAVEDANYWVFALGF
ncbi:MAG: hypothetical protein RJQ04_19425 [Longimicrobiales bacterium]